MSFLSIKKNQFFRFLFTGFLNTIFGYSVFSFLIFFSLNYQLAIIIATILGILFNYQSLKRLVFNKSKNNRLQRFFFTSVAICLLNIYGTGYFLGYGFNVYISFIIIFIPSTLINFFLMKFFVFRLTYKN